MRDLRSRISPAFTIEPQTAAADKTGDEVDLQGFDSAVVELAVGVGGITFSGTNKIEFKLQHGDESDGSDMAAVEAADVEGVTLGTGGIVLALTSAHAAATLTRVGYVGTKRYVRVFADFSGTHGTGTPMSCVVERGHPAVAPVE